MSDKTLIAWTDHTANFWMGCFKISPGCAHCYAETLTKNRMGLRVWGPPATSARQPTKGIWKNVVKWNREAEKEGRPRRVFCMSMGDFFEDHPIADELRPRVWRLIRQTPWLHWQLLTKRSDRIADDLPADWGRHGYANVWLGVSIEDDAHVTRADDLRRIPASVRFVSYEPALGPVPSLDLTGIDWVIVGGESGPGYRPMDVQWARDLRRRCDEAGVAFFWKQMSAPRTEMGIQLDGEIVRVYPTPREVHGHTPSSTSAR